MRSYRVVTVFLPGMPAGSERMAMPARQLCSQTLPGPLSFAADYNGAFRKIQLGLDLNQRRDSSIRIPGPDCRLMGDKLEIARPGLLFTEADHDLICRVRVCPGHHDRDCSLLCRPGHLCRPCLGIGREPRSPSALFL